MADEDRNGSPSSRRGSTPNPDPTVLTTAQVDRATANLYREIALVRELLENKVRCSTEVADGKFDGTKTAIELLDDRINGLIGRTSHDLKQLGKLHTEKFNGVDVQFNEKDKRIEQLDIANKAAIQAALLAQKEMVSIQNVANATAFAKSEENFSKQIDQITTILNTITKSMEDKIADLKQRVDTSEGKKSGGAENWAMILGIAGVAISFIAMAILFISHFGTATPGVH